jgi:hypothetical protein
MPAQRYIAGTTLVLTNVVYVGNTPTDAADITFQWRMGLTGEITSVTPTKTATGTYEVSITPLKGGNLYYRWDTEGVLDTAGEQTLSIANSQFDITA